MQEDSGAMRALSMDELDMETKKGNADLIFTVGEKVKLKGGDFRIKSFSKKMIVLEGLPGTRVKR